MWPKTPWSSGISKYEKFKSEPTDSEHFGSPCLWLHQTKIWTFWECTAHSVDPNSVQMQWTHGQKQ